MCGAMSPRFISVLSSSLLLSLSACVAPPSGEEAGPQQVGVPQVEGADPAGLMAKRNPFKPDPVFAGEPVSTSTLPGGLLVEDFVVGTGELAALGGEVSVHYYGTLADGTMFDTSQKRKKPFTFTLGQGRVIKGWDQGVPGMKVGGKRRLTVPAELGYGGRAKGKIPANSDLTFTLELVKAYAPLPAPQGAEAFAGEPLSKVEQEGGLIVEDFVLGTGREAKAGDQVIVHYTGTLADGTKFDSSVERNKALPFALGTGRVIKGWDQGIAGMKAGGLRRLTIPPALAYGERDKGKIPANSTLTFTVELMAVRDAPPQPKRRPHARSPRAGSPHAGGIK